MRQTRPRQEFQFPTTKDRPDLDYVPARSRDPRRIELFTGKTGLVIPIQQRVGVEALLATYRTMDKSENYGMEDLRAISDLTAMTTLGTAHHAFGEPEAENLAFRRIKIARVYDPKTSEHLTAPKLLGTIETGLKHSVDLAADVEERTLERKDTTKRSDQLGRLLATVGFAAAALHDGIDRQHGSDVDVQQVSWLSARAASQRALDLSDTIGTRPTVAQLPDEQSPLRRYMNDNPWLVPSPAYGVLLDKISERMEAAYDRDDEARMLFN
jgi:hypothetical protein